MKLNEKVKATIDGLVESKGWQMFAADASAIIPMMIMGTMGKDIVDVFSGREQNVMDRMSASYIKKVMSVGYNFPDILANMPDNQLEMYVQGVYSTIDTKPTESEMNAFITSNYGVNPDAMSFTKHVTASASFLPKGSSMHYINGLAEVFAISSFFKSYVNPEINYNPSLNKDVLKNMIAMLFDGDESMIEPSEDVSTIMSESDMIAIRTRCIDFALNQPGYSNAVKIYKSFLLEKNER